MRFPPDLQQLSLVHVCVALRRRQAGVAQQILDRTQIRAAGQQMRGEGVPQRVRCRVLGQSVLLAV